jgi:undecaprenyl-diphosphatase
MSYGNDRRETTGRHAATRGHLRLLWDVIFGLLRLIRKHVRNAYVAFGIFLFAGAAVAIVCTYAFAKLAGHVQSGGTQAFDDAVMSWIAAHQNPLVQQTMIEVTALGTGVVVAMVEFVGALFLWLNKHKHSALLLIIASFGGIILNNLLKLGFGRPRPQIFEWGTYASSSSFPSGHAMSSVIVYGTVAYLAARLQRRPASRLLTLGFAAVVILLICVSRLYLGVHYPSDIAAGLIIGLAWAGFCMAILEVAQLYAKRNAPQMLKDEEPAAAGASPST